MQSQSILRTSYGEFCHYLIGYSKEFGNMQMVPDITYKRRRFEVCNNQKEQDLEHKLARCMSYIMELGNLKSC
jgi:hypothetical protein